MRRRSNCRVVVPRTHRKKLLTRECVDQRAPVALALIQLVEGCDVTGQTDPDAQHDVRTFEPCAHR